jgi:hypothetical protein
MAMSVRLVFKLVFNFLGDTLGPSMENLLVGHAAEGQLGYLERILMVARGAITAIVIRHAMELWHMWWKMLNCLP